MKKLAYLFLFISFLIAGAEEIKANVYASGIKISDESVTDYSLAGNTWDKDFSNGGVKIWFVINEAGVGTLTAQVKVKQGATVVRDLTVTSPVKGVNSVVWDGNDNSSTPVPLGTYTFEVVVSDPVGHSAFDSLWVAGAYYQNGGLDFDGGTSFAYRGTTSIYEQTESTFGNIYVSRGTSSGINGIYEIRGDGQYIRKIGTNPGWPSSVPNELSPAGSRIYGLAGYGATGSGYIKGFDSETNTFVDSSLTGTTNVRSLLVKRVGNDTIFYTLRSGTGVAPTLIKKTGIHGDTTTVISLAGHINGTGYLKAVVIDDAGNYYIAFGDASSSRKRLAVFNSSGTLLYKDSTDGGLGLASGTYFHSLAHHSGSDPNSAADDKIYALIYAPTANATQWGIYSIAYNGTNFTSSQLINLSQGRSTSATAHILNTDPAGNVIWSNGSLNEKIVIYSPAAGPNSYTTQNPTGYDIMVDVALPVELVSFSASVVGKEVVLSWATSSELNNLGFEVERKTNGTWMNIGFVKGSGSSASFNSYNFTDKELQSGNVSYRLKQIDFDGSFTYSKEVEVNVNIPAQFELSQNYPNPFNPETQISFRVPFDSKVRIEIYSLAGELVEVLVDEFKSAGEYNVRFNATNLASGTYIYRLVADNFTVSKKMQLMK